MILGGGRLCESANTLFKCVLTERAIEVSIFFCVSTLQIALIREVMWVPERHLKYFLTYYIYFVNMFCCFNLL